MRSIKYHRHADEKMPEVLRKGCDQCKAKFESETHVCGFCAQEISNKVFLSKGSRHIDGRCRNALRGVKIPERTIDKPLPYPIPLPQPSPATPGGRIR